MNPNPFKNCGGCGAILVATQFAYGVCPECDHHHAIDHKTWRALLLDEGTFAPCDETLTTTDPLTFVDDQPYAKRLANSQAKTGLRDAVVSGRARIDGLRVIYTAFAFEFMGGSMGSVVGEVIARAFEHAIADSSPIVLLSASGGARMQEGILSLMQMAKTVAAREKLRDARLPFISVMRHATTGGVAASFAFLGDINLAEPRALIGFAGPRVIEQTIGQTLPEGFQRSEFLLEHGTVDRIVHRHKLKGEIATILRLLSR